MKRFLLFLLTATAGYNALAQNNGKISVSGLIPEMANGKLTIDFLGKPIAETAVAADGSFNYSGTKMKPGFYHSNLNYFIYLEPGMNLQINRGANGFNFQNKGSVENNLIVNIQKLQYDMLSVKNYSLGETAAFIEPNDFLDKIAAYKKTVNELCDKTNVSKNLATLVKGTAEYDAKLFISQYKIGYGYDKEKSDSASRFLTQMMKNKKPNEPIDPADMQHYSALRRASKVKTLSAEDESKLEVFENFDVNNGSMYAASISYRKLLDDRLRQLQQSELVLTPSLKSKSALEMRAFLVNKHISDPIIREHLLFDNLLKGIRPGIAYEKAYQNYIASAQDEGYVIEVKKQYERMKQLNAGNSSPKFEYEDVEGKLVSSESFKGNYVYIDLWATWCQPCVAEIPALKELQKAYAGKNIQFLSISTDKKADLEKWRSFVREKELTGTQLIVNKDSEFYKFYNIATIPRFVLLDKEGKIIDANAKRPSNPVLKEELDKLLN